MTNDEIKLKFIQELSVRQNSWVRKLSEDQYLTRCPFCGDSSDPTHGHFYIKLNLHTNYNMIYNCVRCPFGGVITKDVCRRLEVDESGIMSEVEVLNKTSDKFDSKHIEGESFKHYDYKIPHIYACGKTMYISKRLNKDFSMKELNDIKVIVSLYEFLDTNGITELTMDKYLTDLLDKYYVGFLSHGNSHILFRDVTDTMKYPWIKYPVTRETSSNRIFYSVSAQINPFTDEEIVINLTEGVMDALSIVYNLNEDQPNHVTLSVTGKFYEPIIIFLIGLGLIGDNVSIHIYADNDSEFNQKNKDKNKDTDIDFYRKMFKDMKYLFKHIKVFYNTIGKDFGVPSEKISLKEYRI